MDEVFAEESQPPEEIFSRIGSPYKKMLQVTSILKSYLSDIDVTSHQEANFQAKKALGAIRMASRKPNLGVMGRSDSGKSHFINTLLGGGDCQQSCSRQPVR